MRWILPLLFTGCAGPDLPTDGGDAPPCAEVVDPLSGGEMSWLGVSPNGLRVLAGQVESAAWGGGGGLQVSVRWAGGMSRQIFATPDPRATGSEEPLWCEDRLEVPGVLRLQRTGGQPLEVAGHARAAGPVRDLSVAFVAQAPAGELAELLPITVAPTEMVQVWAWLDGSGPRGQILDASGAVLAFWDPP